MQPAPRIDISPISAEKRVARLNRLYSALSHTGAAVHGQSDPYQVGHAVCRIAVVEGGLRSASLRLYDAGRHALMAFAGYGPLQGWIGELTIPLNEPRSRAAWSARTLQPYFTGDVMSDPAVAVARDDAEQVGIRSAGALPLAIDSELVGILSVYAAEPNYFDEEIAGLLGEMARHLSFAFSKHRAESALKRVEESLRRSEDALKRSEDALRASEESLRTSEAARRRTDSYYRTLFNSMPQAVRVLCDDRVMLLNPAGQALFGVPGESAIGQSAFACLEPGDREAGRARLRAVIEKREIVRADDLALVRPDGTRVHAEATLLPIEFEGRPAALSIVTDLTERKITERRVRRLASLYQALSRTNEAIFRLSDLRDLCEAVCRIAVDDGGLISASIRAYDAATRKLTPFTGYGPLSGRLGLDVIDIGDPGSNAAMIARQGGHYVCNDIAEDPRAKASKADGAKIGVNASAGFALSIDGQLAGTLSVFAAEKGYFDAEMLGLLDELARNVSFAFSRQRAAAELKRSEERYRMLFNAAPDAMRVVCEGRIVMFNPAGARMLGFAAPEDVIGKPLESTIAPADRAAALERVRIVTTERRPLPRAEQGLLHVDGRVIEAEVISLPFDYEGKPAALTIAHDLTERKAAERVILQMNAELEERVQRRTFELQQALSDLEAFSYTVAHDLRAPLRRMSGFATLLRENLLAQPGAAFGEEEQLFLDRISDGVHTMDRLIEGLLELAQLGRAQLRLGPVDLSAEARSIAASLHAREPARQVQWVIAEGLSAQADARFMRDVLDNLLGNAWKFTSAHATARIEFGALPEGEAPPCLALQPGERIYFVRDDGAGFEPSFTRKLFGTFQRLHAQHEFPGSGIGLASVKRIITHHGGRVCAEGRPEQGACFYFSLPLQQAGLATGF
jgi:PAS domain S-box-containing protein